MRALPRHSAQLSSARALRTKAALDPRPLSSTRSPSSDRKREASKPRRPYDSHASGLNSKAEPSPISLNCLRLRFSA